MSSQKGNIQRTRPQKYKNTHTFKNNLYDKSHITKQINSIQVCNVCERCKKIIEWKIKYKKYKMLSKPATCTKCDQKTIKHAYHTICKPCALERRICPKCGTQSAIVEHKPTQEEQIKLDGEMESMLKNLTERKRRTFLRYVNKGQVQKSRKGKKPIDVKERKPVLLNLPENETSSEDESSSEEEDGQVVENLPNPTREELLLKLKSLMIEKDDKENSDDYSSDYPETESDE